MYARFIGGRTLGRLVDGFPFTFIYGILTMLWHFLSVTTTHILWRALISVQVALHHLHRNQKPILSNIDFIATRLDAASTGQRGYCLQVWGAH